MNLMLGFQNVSERSFVFTEGFHDFVKNFVNTLTHLPVPLFFIGLYILKIYRKQTAHFSPFLSFHISMYASVIINTHTIFINPDVSGVQSLISIPFFYFNYIILSLIFFDLFVVVFQVTNVYSKTCDIHMSGRNIKCVLIVILIVFRLLIFGAVFVLSILDCKIRFDFMNASIHLINIILLISLIIQWKTSGIHPKDSYIFMNSIVMMLLITILEVITIFKHFLEYKFDLPISFDKFVYNIYYFPYLWIISVYICNLTKIQTWIQNQKKRTPVTVVVPECRVVRPQRIDETVISELSVSELETVM
ncbi:hypothetical protein CRE_09506 [Caenorhabditis remanei]|uniref:Uncharacterized protein n=1 Tax=Caenorhabditis remanei TaxID=31234 RepID=E3MIZ2_CAERE|nr:hypothetical protein CRE_09506 [Caenorhabditis remanei]